MTRDELAGWLGSFNRYSGGEGGDRAFWLEAWGGRIYTVDRIKNGEPVIIPNLSAALLGGIQPDKLASMLLKGDDDGLTARFIYFWPDTVALERPGDIFEGHDALNAFKALYGLEMGADEHGNPIPVTVPLTEEAAEFFQAWRVRHRDGEPDGALLGWWGKMPGVCLRLAITFEGLWNSVDGKPLDHVCKAAIEAATVMIDDYLKPMAVRAFGDAAISISDRKAATLAKWIIKTRPKRINTRELQRGAGMPSLGTREDIQGAIEALIEADWLKSEESRRGNTKGRQKSDYAINPYVFETAREQGRLP